MSKRERPIVAIDGPSGAGKSTVSLQVAEALGFVQVNTGALYRAVALAAPERRERAAHVAQRALVGKRPRGHRRAKLRRERRERRDHRAAPHPAVDCRAGRDSAHSSR